MYWCVRWFLYFSTSDSNTVILILVSFDMFLKSPSNQSTNEKDSKTTFLVKVNWIFISEVLKKENVKGPDTVHNICNIRGDRDWSITFCTWECTFLNSSYSRWDNLTREKNLLSSPGLSSTKTTTSPLRISQKEDIPFK